MTRTDAAAVEAASARRRRSLALAAGLCTLLTACSPAADSAPGPSSPTPTASAPSVPSAAPIRIDTARLAAGVMPADVADAATERVARLLFSGLVRYDAKGKAIDEVAASIASDDDRVYEVTLEGGWAFDNGEPITAHSFVDAWNYAARPTTGAYRRQAFAPIVGFDDLGSARARSADAAPATLTGLTVRDDLHFTITLQDPTPGFRERLGDLAFSPLPASALRDPAHFATAPVGNGPYRLEDAWDPSRPVRLRPQSRYLGVDPARNAGVELRPYSDPAAAYADFQAGRLDVLQNVPTNRLRTYRSDFAGRAYAQPVGAADAIVFPVQRDPWRGEAGRLRRLAISRAIDRDATVGQVYAGTRLPATDLAAPVVEGFSKDLCGDACRHDDEQARAALQQAGGLPEALHIAYPADAGVAPAVDAMCTQVTATLGVGCSGLPYPTETALREAVALGKERSPYLETWQMSRPALAAFLVPRFVAGAPQNGGGFDDDLVQTRLTTAATAPQPQQPAAYQDVEADILEQLPVVPLWSVSATGISGPGVQPVRVDAFGSLVYTQITRP